jgi:hypothetical protein
MVPARHLPLALPQTRVRLLPSATVSLNFAMLKIILIKLLIAAASGSIILWAL